MNRRKSNTDTEIIDHIDSLSKSLANLRSDIAAIVRDTVIETMKERKPRHHIEVGYK